MQSVANQDTEVPGLANELLKVIPFTSLERRSIFPYFLVELENCSV